MIVLTVWSFCMVETLAQVNHSVGFQAPPQRSNSHEAGIHLVTPNAKNSSALDLLLSYNYTNNKTTRVCTHFPHFLKYDSTNLY